MNDRLVIRRRIENSKECCHHGGGGIRSNIEEWRTRNLEFNLVARLDIFRHRCINSQRKDISFDVITTNLSPLSYDFFKGI